MDCFCLGSVLGNNQTYDRIQIHQVRLEQGTRAEQQRCKVQHTEYGAVLGITIALKHLDKWLDKASAMLYEFH